MFVKLFYFFFLKLLQISPPEDEEMHAWMHKLEKHIMNREVQEHVCIG